MAILEGSADFINSCIDDSLGELSSTRYLVLNANATATASVTIPAFGDLTYIYIVLVLNIILSAFYIIQAIRTSFWRDIASLDIMDITNVVVGAMKGGTSLAGGSPDTLYNNAGNTFSPRKNKHELDIMVVQLHDEASAYPALVPIDTDVRADKTHSSKLQYTPFENEFSAPAKIEYLSLGNEF